MTCPHTNNIELRLCREIADDYCENNAMLILKPIFKETDIFECKADASTINSGS